MVLDLLMVLCQMELGHLLHQEWSRRVLQSSLCLQWVVVFLPLPLVHQDLKELECLLMDH